MAQTNREYKDRLFRFIFGNEANKEWTLSLYNAVNGSDYTNADDVEITTIEDAVYMGMKNDVSFLFSGTMNLYEHQSTYNPNMPLRYLIYSGELYSKYVDKAGVYLYSPNLQNVPVPKCVCFYNGEEDREDRFDLKLSQAYNGRTGDIEVVVHMININYGRNKELFENCKPLNEYAWFVDRVRKYRKDSLPLAASTEEALMMAIDRTLEEMPDDYGIKPFLLQNRAEVTSMCISEYNEAKNNELLRAECLAEGRAEGEAIGEARGTIKTIISFLRSGFITEDIAAEKANMSVAEFRKLAAQFA